MSRRMFPIVLLAILFSAGAGASGMGRMENPDLCSTNINRRIIAQSVLDGISGLQDPVTGLAPSHWGQPGFENLGFFYDNCALALILDAGGRKKEAERIVDYYLKRYRIPLSRLRREVDSNDIFGIIGLVRGKDNEIEAKALINAMDIGNDASAGKGLMEYDATPGPLSFFIFAMLKIDTGKYLKDALEAGKALLAWQSESGGIFDGTRNPDRYYTEPHTDSLSAFMMLYRLTGDRKWKDAADLAYNWFRRNVYETNTGRVYQGIWVYDKPNRVFAGDGFAWTMSGSVGDMLPLGELKQMTDYWISRCLVMVKAKQPDGSNRTMVLADFSDPHDPETVRVRNGFHPMGSMEWTGGAILALQKNAVRFWEGGHKATARYYKSLAEILLNQTFRSYYRLPGRKGLFPFYATGQCQDVGPFGSGKGGDYQGWKTPVYYIKTPEPENMIHGCSPVGAWPLLPYYGVNPFILNDPYMRTYELIDDNGASLTQALQLVKRTVADRTYQEPVLTRDPWSDVNIVEPGTYNEKIWSSIKTADQFNMDGDKDLAESHYQKARAFASGVLKDRKWLQLARRENRMKADEIGGLIWYPWGRTYEWNDGEYLKPILRYPLLNDVASTVYGMILAEFELGRMEDARKHMEILLDDLPLHQVAAIDPMTANRENLICGFWNALEAWECSSMNTGRDTKLAEMYWDILKSRGSETARPETVMYDQTKRFRNSNSLKKDDLNREKKLASENYNLSRKSR